MSNVSTLEKPSSNKPSNIQLEKARYSQILQNSLLINFASLIWSDQDETIFSQIDSPEPSHNSDSPNCKNDGLTGGIDTANMSVLKLLKQAQKLKLETKPLNQENLNQGLGQNQLDCMAAMMNGICCQNAKDSEIYPQYHCDSQNGLMTAIMMKESLIQPERIASQIETGNEITKEQLKEMYLKFGENLANDYPDGILIFDPKNPDPKIRDYAKKNLEGSLSRALMINGGKPRFLVLNIDAFYKYVNAKKFSLERSKSFMRGALFNEWYDTNNAKNEISTIGESAGQFSSGAFTTVTESAVHTENPKVEFIQGFVKIIGRLAIAYEATEFKPGIIPDLDIPIISNSLREGAQKLGFPIFEFTVNSGGIIPTGMPNTNTTKNADTYAGTASQLVETNGAFELDTRKGSDTVAMIVDRQKTRIRMGNGDDAGFFIVMPDCELIVDGGVGSNQITAVIMPGGKITYTNFAPELTKIIDLSGKALGDGPRIASSLNSDFDPLNYPNSTNPNQTLQFAIAQDNPNFGNNDILLDSPNPFENKQIQATFGNVNELNGEIFNSNNPNQKSQYLSQNPSQTPNQFPDQNANFNFQNSISPSLVQIFIQNTVNSE